MKKSLLILIASVSSLSIFAQDDVVIKGSGATPVTEQMAPKKVVDSLHGRFPDAKSVQYFKANPANVKKWNITHEDNLQSGETVDHYTISFKRDDMQYYGLYDANGNLLVSRLEQKDAELPEAVKASLKKAGEGKGYTLVDKTYYKTSNYGNHKEYYEVTATNGTKKKKVIVAPDGTIVKVK